MGVRSWSAARCLKNQTQTLEQYYLKGHWATFRVAQEGRKDLEKPGPASEVVAADNMVMEVTQPAMVLANRQGVASLVCKYKNIGNAKEIRVTLLKQTGDGFTEICASSYTTEFKTFSVEEVIECHVTPGQNNVTLTLAGLQADDTGLYICKMERMYPPPYFMNKGNGTHLYVIDPEPCPDTAIYLWVLGATASGFFLYSIIISAILVGKATPLGLISCFPKTNAGTGQVTPNGYNFSTDFELRRPKECEYVCEELRKLDDKYSQASSKGEENKPQKEVISGSPQTTSFSTHVFFPILAVDRRLMPLCQAGMKAVAVTCCLLCFQFEVLYDNTKLGGSVRWEYRNALDRLDQWVKINYVRFNKAKFQVLHLGHKIQATLQAGGRVSGELPGQQLAEDEPVCAQAAKKASGILACINYCVARKIRAITVTLYSAPVRARLESRVQFWAPHYRKDIEML
ncbi:hypothetical protein DUI87_04365 [Hirundo rustica rustica]|uniref:Cytotoxic T-lymphocyte protein 4 n=1 Tax=Hirundo rustica rustica TaxID=333673 RepID=A0A3M0L099_HIRRU|nr:hypothetical protein DUI87_04365 [Hirundo rustica rustica]